MFKDHANGFLCVVAARLAIKRTSEEKERRGLQLKIGVEFLSRWIKGSDGVITDTD